MNELAPAAEHTSAVGQLYDDVRSYFDQKSSGVNVVFGRRERWKQINEGTQGANRVCVIPGRVPSGDDGALEGPVGPGELIEIEDDEAVGIPRALSNQVRIVTFSMWAADTDNDPGAREERAQQEIIEQFFEWVQRAVKRSIAGRANAVWGPCRYNAEPREIRYGVEYLAELALEAQWFDDTPEAATAQGVAVNRGDLT